MTPNSFLSLATKLSAQLNLIQDLTPYPTQAAYKSILQDCLQDFLPAQYQVSAIQVMEKGQKIRPFSLGIYTQQAWPIYQSCDLSILHEEDVRAWVEIYPETRQLSQLIPQLIELVPHKYSNLQFGGCWAPHLPALDLSKLEQTLQDLHLPEVKFLAVGNQAVFYRNEAGHWAYEETRGLAFIHAWTHFFQTLKSSLQQNRTPEPILLSPERLSVQPEEGKPLIAEEAVQTDLPPLDSVEIQEAAPEASEAPVMADAVAADPLQEELKGADVEPSADEAPLPADFSDEKPTEKKVLKKEAPEKAAIPAQPTKAEKLTEPQKEEKFAKPGKEEKFAEAEAMKLPKKTPVPNGKASPAKLSEEGTVPEDLALASQPEKEKTKPAAREEEGTLHIPTKNGLPFSRDRKKASPDQIANKEVKEGEREVTTSSLVEPTLTEEITLPIVNIPTKKPKKRPKQNRRSHKKQELDHKSGNHPIHLAVLADDVDSVRNFLQDGTDPDIQNKQGDTGLHISSSHNRLEIAELLILGQAQVNARNHVYATPLHLAVEFGHADLVSLLVESGAEVEVRNNRGKTPMIEAAEKGSLGALAVLIDHGADIHASMERGLQALHLAAWYGHIEVMEHLLAHHADINATNDDGNTPLHIAAFNGQVKAIKTLINHHADPSVPNFNGETYLQGINEGYQGEMVKLLG
ncbi:MAG: ankyrin repeat domain-containing protein [Bacteroidota bacterium]